MNYGIAAEQKSVPGSNRYTLEGKRGISSCLCTSCGVEFPLKSNIGIVEEIGRLASYLSPPTPLCCSNKDCTNYIGRIPAGAAGAYASFGKTAIGNPRWRCNVCGKTFSQPLCVHEGFFFAVDRLKVEDRGLAARQYSFAV